MLSEWEREAIHQKVREGCIYSDPYRVKCKWHKKETGMSTEELHSRNFEGRLPGAIRAFGPGCSGLLLAVVAEQPDRIVCENDYATYEYEVTKRTPKAPPDRDWLDTVNRTLKITEPQLLCLCEFFAESLAALDQQRVVSKWRRTDSQSSAPGIEEVITFCRDPQPSCENYVDLLDKLAKGRCLSVPEAKGLFWTLSRLLVGFGGVAAQGFPIMTEASGLVLSPRRLRMKDEF